MGITPERFRAETLERLANRLRGRFVEFTISRDAHHLLVRVAGRSTESDKRHMLSEVARQSKDAGLASVLLECSSGLDPASTLSLVNDLQALGFPNNTKIAVLAANDEARETAEFAETAALNRGWRVQSFTERRVAMAWLDA